MFSKDITGSDAFREMPASSQSLYFHLGMEADDDGFLDSYRGLMRSTNASDDDLKLLIAKRFLILFPSKIIVVKHWKLNNYIPKDRYTETKHLEEKRALIIKENGSYTDRIQDVYTMDTQNRIGEKSKEKNTSVAIAPQKYELVKEEERPKKEGRAKYPHSKEVFAFWGKYPRFWERNATQLAAAEDLYAELGLEEIKSSVEFLEKHKDDKFCPEIYTPHDLLTKYKKLEAFSHKI